MKRTNRKLSAFAAALSASALVAGGCLSDQADLDSAALDVDECTRQADEKLNECLPTCDTYLNDYKCETEAGEAFEEAMEEYRALHDQTHWIGFSENAKLALQACYEDPTADVERFRDKIDKDLADAGYQDNDFLQWWYNAPTEVRYLMEKKACFDDAMDLTEAEEDEAYELWKVAAASWWDRYLGCWAENVGNDWEHFWCQGYDVFEGYQDYNGTGGSAGCYGKAQAKYVSCRKTCEAPAQTACWAGPEWPSYVDCGAWEVGLDNSCECRPRWGNGQCGSFDVARITNRLLNEPCPEQKTDPNDPRPWLHTYVVQYDENGSPDGYEVICLPRDSNGMPIIEDHHRRMND